MGDRNVNCELMCRITDLVGEAGQLLHEALPEVDGSLHGEDVGVQWDQVQVQGVHSLEEVEGPQVLQQPETYRGWRGVTLCWREVAELRSPDRGAVHTHSGFAGDEYQREGHVASCECCLALES